MNPTSQEYANLVHHAYDPAVPPGVYSSKDAPEVTVGGITYKIREHVDNARTGYQGTIYQRADTGDLVVAHRGTEFDREPWQDGATVDGGMVFLRINQQAPEAIELTRRAMELAQRDAPDRGHPLEVTITGHSLGGCLTQITAHHFNLRGETFNPYGAVSLEQLRIPEGGDRVINHVMAGDAVSAASAHYGQVRVYASQQEIAALDRSGYENDRDAIFNVRSPVLGAIRSGDSHRLHNFLDVDGNGHPDRSVLTDPRARQLARQFDPMIDRYRDDMAFTRGLITAEARSGMGWLRDVVDARLGPDDPGAPAKRDAQRAHQEALAAQRQYLDPSYRSGLSLPDYVHPNGRSHPPLKRDLEYAPAPARTPHGASSPDFLHVHGRPPQANGHAHDRERHMAAPALGFEPSASATRRFSHFLHSMLEADDATFDKMIAQRADSPAGRAIVARGEAFVNREEQQLAAQQHMEQQAQQHARRAHAR